MKRLIGPFTYNTVTDEAGAYRMQLPIGSYDLIASALGCICQTASHLPSFGQRMEVTDA